MLRHNLVTSELGEVDEPIFKLALKLNLLIIVGLDPKNPLKNVYAFYHSTFEEYFAALEIEDWYYFLSHNNQTDLPNYKKLGTLFSPQYFDYFAEQEIGKWTILLNLKKRNQHLIKDKINNYVYRVFEPQWKEVILLWLRREGDVELIQQKEKFIKSLVEFEDECMGLYSFRAYFLAAEGIAEFRDCTQSNKIVTQIVDWSLGYSNDNAIGKAAMAVLASTDCVRVYKYLNELDNSYENDLDDDPSLLRQEVITLAYAIISGYNPNEAFEEDSSSVNYLNSDEDGYLNTTSIFGEILPKNFIFKEEEIDTLIIRLLSTQERRSIINSALSLVNLLPNYLLPKVVSGLRECLKTDKFTETPTHGHPFAAYENEFYRFKCCYLVLLYCAQNMSYREFYEAWHNQ